MANDEKYFDSNKLIDEVLTVEPKFALPDDFAEKLAEKVGRKYAWEQYFKEFLIYLAVFAGVALIVAAISLIWYEANWREWLNFMRSNTFLIAGINILVIFVLFVDRVLLRYLFYRNSLELY